MRKFCLPFTLVIVLTSILFRPGLAGTTDPAVQKWHDNKYSMFIHFGVYSHLGGVWEGKPVTRGYSEQIQAHAGIMTDLYDEVPESFNPEKWNAAEIVALAKKAGMRSIVITTKHHDGFCMYHTAFTRFNIVDATPFKRDIMKELSEACRKEGMNLGFYFSLIDYRLHPWASHNANPITADHHEYNKKQVRELLTNYGPISEMWFDMGSLTSTQSHEIYDLVHSLQPGCMVSGRLGNDAFDFCVMGDNQVPDYRIDTPWQTPASMFDETWGYRSWQKRGDTGEKAREKLLSLIHVVGRGGNYLLNIGPMGNGAVVPFEAEVLTSIGQWLQKNGEAIYGTTANPLNFIPGWGEITAKGNCLYLIVTGDPGSALALPGLSGHVKSASLVGSPETAVEARYSKGILRVSLPANFSSSKDIRVVRLEFSEGFTVKPDHAVEGKGGKTVLDFHNSVKRYSYSSIDYYTNHRTVVGQEWEIKKSQAGRKAAIWFTEGELGGEIEISFNGKPLVITLQSNETHELQPAKRVITWGKRYALGPYESDFEGNPGPVKETIDPAVTWDSRHKFSWKPLVDWPESADENSGSRPLQSKYILQEIDAAQASRQLIWTGSKDGIEAWLNGEQLVCHTNPRESVLSKDVILLPLRQGKNQLLVKFYNRFGYTSPYRISNGIRQAIYRMELKDAVPAGTTRIELKLHQPVSRHQSSRLANVSLEL